MIPKRTLFNFQTYFFLKKKMLSLIYRKFRGGGATSTLFMGRAQSQSRGCPSLSLQVYLRLHRGAVDLKQKDVIPHSFLPFRANQHVTHQHVTYWEMNSKLFDLTSVSLNCCPWSIPLWITYLLFALGGRYIESTQIWQWQQRPSSCHRNVTWPFESRWNEVRKRHELRPLSTRTCYICTIVGQHSRVGYGFPKLWCWSRT